MSGNDLAQRLLAAETAMMKTLAKEPLLPPRTAEELTLLYLSDPSKYPPALDPIHQAVRAAGEEALQVINLRK